MTAPMEVEIAEPGNSGAPQDGPGAYLYAGKRPMRDAPDEVEVEPIPSGQTMAENVAQLSVNVPDFS